MESEDVWKFATTHIITAMGGAISVLCAVITVMWKYIARQRKDQIARDEARQKTQNEREDDWHEKTIGLAKSVVETQSNSVHAMNNLAKLVDKQTEHNDKTYNLIMQALLNKN